MIVSFRGANNKIIKPVSRAVVINPDPTDQPACRLLFLSPLLHTVWWYMIKMILHHLFVNFGTFYWRNMFCCSVAKLRTLILNRRENYDFWDLCKVTKSSHRFTKSTHSVQRGDSRFHTRRFVSCPVMHAAILHAREPDSTVNTTLLAVINNTFTGLQYSITSSTFCGKKDARGKGCARSGCYCNIGVWQAGKYVTQYLTSGSDNR